jgi:hypothetical protein
VFRLIAFTAALFSLSSCANYLMRKQCDKINWYQHGHEIALRGERPAQDRMLNECKKAEADVKEAELDRGFKSGMDTYCKAETVETTGRKGEFFNTDLCDPGQIGILKQRHTKGVVEFCKPANGYKVGATGWKYNQICPKNLSEAFLKEHSRGRVVFLTQEIKANQTLITQNQSEMAQVEARKRDFERELRYIPQPKNIVERTYNPAIQGYSEVSRTEDPYEEQRRRVTQDMQSQDYKIRELQEGIKKKQLESLELEKELAALQGQ